MLGRELRRIAKRAPLTLRLMLRAFNPHAREDSHGVTETQRRFTAGALPQTPKAGPLTSDKITGFYRIDRIFLILNPVNHDNPVILSKKHRSYPQLHSRACRRSSGIVGRGSKMGKLQVHGCLPRTSGFGILRVMERYFNIAGQCIPGEHLRQESINSHLLRTMR